MILEKLKGIIVDELGVEESEITLEANITDDLGADSLDAVELIMAIEDEFEVKVSDEVAQSFKTVGQIVKFIEGEK
ncbi:acyl carrier protein [Candidatus Izimaplasma bacterium ZiA1]|uniref:acyl carrier protein n=1 Tax=Candidatus Izimoplasma sp. ZiA1 TaxID=2024899 RepID=UPI000BAA64C1|nr:acyl carrier protein [Candidatus Izimaplasma bacterium ZiA1]